MSKEQLKKYRDKLNAKSCSFCLAKWTQSTIHLHNGTTHSCHHPTVHKIPLVELEENFTALHNTNFKKERRKEMLEGIRPKECQYCWNIEDSGDNFSDRIIKSHDYWSSPYFNEITKSKWDEDYMPKYVEVSFSNVCNLKCAYCSPVISSKWMEEINRYGPYPTSEKYQNLEWLKRNDLVPYLHKEENPYVNAFWKWWPELYKNLHVFRITGGEPLLDKNLFKVLDWIIENPNPNKDLELAINSNLSVPEKLLVDLIEKLKIILDGDKVKSFTLFTSVEAYGEQAEYIRHGLDFKYQFKNIERLLEIPKLEICVIATYNLMSVPSFMLLLKRMKELKDKYPVDKIAIDIPYLRKPEHLTIKLLPLASQKIVKSHLDYMRDNFSDRESEKMERILKWMQKRDESPKEITRLRKDFYLFIAEHDRRRKTNFCETFPDLLGFYEYCEGLTDD